MKLSRVQRNMALALIVDPLPPSVRSEFATDEQFCSRFGIKPKFWFPLDAMHSVETASLHNALRAAIAGRKTANLVLPKGERVRVKLGRKRDNARIILDKNAFGFSNSSLLSAGQQDRVRALESAFSKQPLQADEEAIWRSRIKKRALKDREFIDLTTVLSATPEAFTDTFERPRSLDADGVMPDESDYYLRLVGAVPSSGGLDEFIEGPLAAARKGLIASHPKAALRRIAYTALWQPLIPFDLLKSLKARDVRELLRANDPFSLLYGFELCRAGLSKESQFLDLGSLFLHKLLADKKASVARCNLFSACALIATAKIRSKAHVTGMPLFWVRLAALAHASVLTNALSSIQDTTEFLRWAAQNLYPSYRWVSAIDLHDAPRWDPEWIDPEYLYAELVGRVQGSLALLAEEERPRVWKAALGVAIKRLRKTRKLLASTFAGPFDDFRERLPVLSSSVDAFRNVEKKLAVSSKLSDVPGLFALACVSHPSDQVIMHVRRILNAPVEEGIANKQELMFLRLCARIGRVARDQPLADAIINRCLFMARRPKGREALTDIFEVIVEACSAWLDIDEYRAQLGEAAAKLCFATDDSKGLNNLVVIFDVLSMRDEKLTARFGRARAIAKTKIGRQSS